MEPTDNSDDAYNMESGIWSEKLLSGDLSVQKSWLSSSKRVEAIAEEFQSTKFSSLSSAEATVSSSSLLSDFESTKMVNSENIKLTSSWLSEKLEQVETIESEEWQSQNVEKINNESTEDPMLVYHNRSARRLEALEEQIQTRKVRKEIIQSFDDSDDEDGVDVEEIIQTIPNVTSLSSSEAMKLFAAESIAKASKYVSSTAKMAESWSSERMESVESVESVENVIIEDLQSSQVCSSQMKSSVDTSQSQAWSSIRTESLDSELNQSTKTESVDSDNMSTASQISRRNSVWSSSGGVSFDESINDPIEPEVEVKIRRPSQSSVQAEAFIFSQRKSLEKIDAEIIIRKKRRPKPRQEMVEEATIVLNNCKISDNDDADYSAQLSEAKSKSSRREEILFKRGSLDTETDSMEEEDDQSDPGNSNNIVDSMLDKDALITTNTLFDSSVNINRTPTVFKSDEELNSLF